MNTENTNRESSIRVTIIGAGGRMGLTLVRCLYAKAIPGLKLTGAIDLWDCAHRDQDAGLAAGCGEMGVPITCDLKALFPETDILVDFGGHKGTAGNAPRIAEAGKAWVIGATGLTEEEMAEVKTAAKRIPIVIAPNMSLGMNLLFSMVEQAAASLKDKGYDVEIIERHHRRKKDAPSGTALGLGKAVAKGLDRDLNKVAVHGREGQVGERTAEEIGFHAIRGGDIVGDHTVLFAADGELIEFSHRATSRDAFALGALRAAEWVADKSAGMYTMKDVLGI